VPGGEVAARGQPDDPHNCTRLHRWRLDGDLQTAPINWATTAPRLSRQQSTRHWPSLLNNLSLDNIPVITRVAASSEHTFSNVAALDQTQVA